MFAAPTQKRILVGDLRVYIYIYIDALEEEEQEEAKDDDEEEEEEGDEGCGVMRPFAEAPGNTPTLLKRRKSRRKSNADHVER